eukprot:gnl/Spiro4/8678_TR4535_c0_g1_i1.p1 gnl/Spiro4/8678_TR4535_c0_g1~~gnl/Spiro4/8678_TR4535_c0_g1_i1.p1  ORF type:complete len:386 (+),score=57.22 gnl/Spiro4/8678_TR4535_c0_g1_i1:102-1160(+)
MVVTIPYADLMSSKDLSEPVLEAYGPGGLGALTISGIPEYAERRQRLIPMTHTFAHLPPEVQALYEHPESLWNSGWSFGREKLGDVVDRSKGSYYANPCYDDVPNADKFAPVFFPKNRWPSKHMPEMEAAFKALGTIMFNTTALLARQVDRIVEKRLPTYKRGLISSSIQGTHKIKGRMLYYYPNANPDVDDGWIGWHNDSGFLTALTCDMYFDDATGKRVQNPDPQGGLWIVDRNSGAVSVKIPEDELAIQCGECLQVVTGGLMVATPHCVRASRCPPGVAPVGRGTFPVFIDVGPDFRLEPPAGLSREAILGKSVHSKVPPLGDRWTSGMTFEEFCTVTFSQYYNHNFKK